MLEVDRYALARVQQLQDEILAHLQAYEFHPVAGKLQMYCSEDLGGFYLDILKDRLYTAGADSQIRRSAQTAIWHITHALLRLMAPILSFTAEEAWSHFAGAALYAESDETIFTRTFHLLPHVEDGAALLAKYSRIREVRAEVTKELEEVRVSGAIGSSLQAEVEIRADAERYALLQSLGDDLKFVLITSAATLTEAAEGEESVTVTPADAEKCERCWHYRRDVGADARYPGICARCVSNLYGPGEARRCA
jgi:isoleucyl-tRNA synthetase